MEKTKGRRFDKQKLTNETVGQARPKRRRSIDEPGSGTEKGSVRCCCGNLLARLVTEGVELKCRRCKRFVVLPLQVQAGGIGPAAE